MDEQKFAENFGSSIRTAGCAAAVEVARARVKKKARSRANSDDEVRFDLVISARCFFCVWVSNHGDSLLTS